MTEYLPWLTFIVPIITMMVFDLFILHREPHRVTIKESLTWTLIWASIAFAFCGYVAHNRGVDPALDFLTGYILEYSLSVDNLFVFLIIFRYFRIPLVDQHHVLMWGILGAIVLRGLFIWIGVSIVNQFEWVLYIFGVFLIYTGIKLFFQKKDSDEETPKLLRYLNDKVLPVRPYESPHHFFVRHNGKIYMTSLFVALLCLEGSDVVFAVDSIPAIFAITRDPFIIFTSNIFAILGLRSLYFLLAHASVRFKFLSHGVAFILFFVGVKLLIHNLYEIPSFLSLMIILIALLMAILYSLYHEKKGGQEEKH